MVMHDPVDIHVDAYMDKLYLGKRPLLHHHYTLYFPFGSLTSKIFVEVGRKIIKPGKFAIICMLK